MKTTVNIFRTLLLSVLTLTFGACNDNELMKETELNSLLITKIDGIGEVWDGTIAPTFAGGIGTQDNPFQIASGAQLAKLADDVNSGTTYYGKFFVLTANIVLNNTDGWENWSESNAPNNSWIPIGNHDHEFRGTLDGKGYTVSGIYIYSNNRYMGLVGYLNFGTIRNLGVKASYIGGGNETGAICGTNHGTISHCYNDGIMFGCGGVCGENYGIMSYCYNSGTVIRGEGVCYYNSDSGSMNNCYNKGIVKEGSGLCGQNNGSIYHCYNTNTVNVSTRIDVGGICRSNYGSITNCYNTGNVLGKLEGVGGISGRNSGNISYCYNTGKISGGYYNAGISGDNVGTISYCNNTGSVNGGYEIGGICGGNGGSITDCYNVGLVIGEDNTKNIGGVCGSNARFVTNCHNVGKISGNGILGGVCGIYNDTSGMVANCYYLDSTADSGIGGGLQNYAQAIGKTQVEFANGTVAALLGVAWKQVPGTDYPVLKVDATKPVYEYTFYNGTSVAETRYANTSDDIVLPEGSNAIVIINVSSPLALASGDNIIIKNGNTYTCKSFALTDGADFYTPVFFSAKKAIYTRTPKVWANGESGWETLCLPFSGTLYAGEEAKQPVDVASNKGAYWLRSLTGFTEPNTLIFASPATAADNQIKAGVPYIIALPGNTFVGESLEGQTISVRGMNVTVTNVAQSVQPEGSWLAFTGTFATKACDAASYRLNSENGSDGAGDLFVFDTNKLAPFRCRIDVKGLIIGGASTRSASGLPKELRIGQ